MSTLSLRAPTNSSKLRQVIGAIIYIRVSTKEQTDMINLLQRLLRRFADRGPLVSLTIVAVVAIAAFAGNTAEQRPGPDGPRVEHHRVDLDRGRIGGHVGAGHARDDLIESHRRRRY